MAPAESLHGGDSDDCVLSGDMSSSRSQWPSQQPSTTVLYRRRRKRWSGARSKRRGRCTCSPTGPTSFHQHDSNGDDDHVWCIRSVWLLCSRPSLRRSRSTRGARSASRTAAVTTHRERPQVGDEAKMHWSLELSHRGQLAGCHARVGHLRSSARPRPRLLPTTC